ncbi:hypothetical protein [Stieleria mannarensis]|uniref:hypothetical protein n=1 Tax=Stieleria mannarensis TaxID=2755585 RepID=UPI0016036902|nr:hypothetical protein [Rhodopirellula sp. JC639]
MTTIRISNRLRFASRRGAALLLAIFVMTLVSTLAVATLDAEMMRYMALRNTREWDEARYLAEAGLNDAFAHLEDDISWRDGIPATEYPQGSGWIYRVSVADGGDATVELTSTGTVGNFTRTLHVRVKQGG